MESTRQDVYEAIDSERKYQDFQEELNGWKKKRTVGEWIVLINHYTTKLNETWTITTGDRESLEVMRKIAGIAVHCMEENGAIKREI